MSCWAAVSQRARQRWISGPVDWQGKRTPKIGSGKKIGNGCSRIGPCSSEDRIGTCLEMRYRVYNRITLANWRIKTHQTGPTSPGWIFPGQ